MKEFNKADVSLHPNFEEITAEQDFGLEKEKISIGSEIKYFEEELVFRIRELVSQEEIDEQEWSEILKSIKKLKFLSFKTYSNLSNENHDPQFFHDVGNLAHSVFGYRDLLLMGDWVNGVDKRKKYLGKMVDAAVPYALILEDLLSRADNGIADRQWPRRNLNINNLFQALDFFKSTNALNGLVKNKLIFEKPDYDLLNNDEVVATVPGVVVNSMFNMIRNACKERIGANKVHLDFKREGDELVIQIIDNGRGMRAQHLIPDYVLPYNETAEDQPFSEIEDSGFIFDKGKKSSGTGSTGLGLANLDKRIVSVGGILRVASRRKFVSGKIGQQIDFTTEGDQNKLSEIHLDKDQSTVFEIRLPITKK